MPYEWTDDMGEISGFGGVYEEACRQMVRQGLEWWEAHPDATPQHRGLHGVYGLIMADNPDAAALDQAICAGVEPTGAMHHAALNTICFIRQHGWERYQEVMRKQEAEAEKKPPPPGKLPEHIMEGLRQTHAMIHPDCGAGRPGDSTHCDAWNGLHAGAIVGFASRGGR